MDNQSNKLVFLPVGIAGIFVVMFGIQQTASIITPILVGGVGALLAVSLTLLILTLLENLCHPYGERIYDLPRQHLAPHWFDAPRLGNLKLCIGVDLTAYYQFIRVGDRDLPNMGADDQHLYPDQEPAQPIRENCGRELMANRGVL